MMMNRKISLVICVLMMACVAKIHAAVAVSRLIGNNMVLQRGVKTKIWGTAAPLESIKVIFKGKQYQALADKGGAWAVMLDAAVAGGPYVLSIKGKSNAIEVKNLMIGDVWLCSGQSNMQFTVSGAMNAANEIAAANDPGIRHFKVPNLNSEVPQSQLVGGEWLESSPATTGGFTAVGYFFAREMRKLHPDVPIGLINASWGGTRIETWIDYEGFGWKGVEDLKKYHEREYVRRLDLLKKGNNWTPTESDAGTVNGLPQWVATAYDDSKWMNWTAPGWWWGNGLEFFGGVLWMRKSFDLPADVAAGSIALSLGVFDDNASVWINGNLIDSTNNRSGMVRQYVVPSKYLIAGKNTITLKASNLDAGGGLVGSKDQLKITADFYQQSLAGTWKYRIGKFEYAPQSQPQTTPAGLFNAMISPLTSYTIGGALWYQGEQNATDISNAYRYRDLLNTLVTNWRAQFSSGAFPFVVVQLPNHQKPAAQPTPSNWAVMRESQYQVLSLPNTALVCTIDLGDADDIHPVNKQDVGKRVALAVRKLVFKEDKLDTGPVFDKAKVVGDSIRITLKGAAKGLVSKDKYGYVTGFSIAGSDKKFVWAQARIEGMQVVVWSEKVKVPVSVRYGWANNPADASVYSSEGLLPLAPFRMDNFKAEWIGPPDVDLKKFGVYQFRKSVQLANKPNAFVVHVSADNRYQLYVNGARVACGPQRSDLEHWRYDVVDLAPYLKKGKNVIAATVWNQGQHAAWAQISLQTGFWLEGEGAASAVNSDASWRVIENAAYTPIADALHITGPYEQISSQQFPWGWNEESYDDSNWPDAIETGNATASQSETKGGRQLLKRNIPMPEEKPQRFNSIRRVAGAVADNEFLKGTKPLEVPPFSNFTLLLDQGMLTTAYPELLVSGGNKCKITLTYAEALYSDQGGQKGNRNEVEGKSIRGNRDVFILDGGAKRLFRPLYYRTFRYVEVKIENQDFPLILHDVKSSFTAYPFVENASFKSSDASLKKIWDTGWLTSRLCAYETYMDCPYYEQLQYLGDTRIQALISLYVSGDDHLMKNAISQFGQSGIAEGLTQSRYPSNVKQVIPPFSLFWIGVLHDYHMLGSDEQFVKGFLPGVDRILKWHQQYINEKGMLGKMPYWNFVDWPKEWPWKGEEEISGIPASALTGNSAVLTLQYAYALNYAAALYRNFGMLDKANTYQALAEKLNRQTYNACWDSKREMMADSPEKNEFSQHTNAMAVLSGAISVNDQQQLLLNIENNPDIIQCTIYYRFYLIQAFKKAGLGGEYIRLLKPWNKMLDLGLTTFAERPEPTRSDCHAWSASPVYDLLATVCGITPLKPGFKAVRIAPELGSLSWIEGVMPHPGGKIKVKLKLLQGVLSGQVSLPTGITGEFVWQGRTIKLKGGEQLINVTNSSR